ncbi:MAG: hypothetical protein V7K90_24780, partial [Nostoc sp.]|uniref:hypothetical protein n=1 Tax=Nostoc sp. TaxID=1180 RepID=UPI002FFA91D6
MQIIQPLLGNNIHPLGLRSSLSHPHGMLLRKESHFLHSRSNFISSIQTKPPLVTSSKFLLSREHEASIEPLIGWDSWDTQDINNEFPLVDFDSSDSRTPLKNSNINSSEPIKSSIPEIMPTRIENNTSNDTSSEIKIKGKSKSKKINKSQQPPEKKSTPKSKTKKTVKSSATKLVDKSKIPINFNEDSLLASDEPLPVEANLELPTLQLDIASDNITNERDSIGIITPSITASISPSSEDKSTLFRNIVNGEVQANSELASSLPNAESSVIESISQLQQKNKLDGNVNELAETSLIEFSLPNNIEETFIPPLLIKNEPKIITEASESVNISDIPVSLTPTQQDSETDQFTSIVDNQTTAFPINLIQKKEVLPILNPPSPKEESPHTNSNFEEITAIESDLILESNTNDFVTDNSVENTGLSSVFTSLNVDDTLHVLANEENTVGAHSYVPLPDVAVPNSKSSVAKKPIGIQQEIISSVTSESPGSTPVQLTPISADIEDTPSLFTNSDNNEQLVTVNVLDVSANVTSLQHDSNLENTVSESTESHPILALPEIAETPTITAISPQIAETAMSNDKPLDIYAPLPTTSPEIAETPTITAISPQIAETAMSNDKPLDIYAP